MTTTLALHRPLAPPLAEAAGLPVLIQVPRLPEQLSWSEPARRPTRRRLKRSVRMALVGMSMMATGLGGSLVASKASVPEGASIVRAEEVEQVLPPLDLPSKPVSVLTEVADSSVAFPGYLLPEPN